MIGELGESHKVGPDLSAIGFEATGRVPGMSAAEYIHQSIVNPNAYLAPACPNGPCLPNIMPKDYSTRLSAEQLEIVVNYLLEQTEVIPAPETIGADTTIDAVIAAKAAPAGKLAPKGTKEPSSGISPLVTVQLLVLGLVLILSLVLLLRQRRSATE